MSEAWGPWIEHDGRGCPCRGKFVEAVDLEGRVDRFIAGTQVIFESGAVRQIDWTDGEPNAWTWHSLDPFDAGFAIVRYRIRKPRALIELRELIAQLPQGVDA